MTRSSHKLLIAVAGLFVVGLVAGSARAADKTKVDEQTSRVEHGAKQMGQGEIGSGLKEMLSGVGHTVVEGTKFSGRTVGEFFKRVFSG